MNKNNISSCACSADMILSLIS